MGLPVAAALTQFEVLTKRRYAETKKLQCILSLHHGMASALVC
jgi:hypothetical protein